MFGRKARLAVANLILGTAFGVFCGYKGVDLATAGLYWASVSASSIGYFHYNVRQDAVLTKNGNGSSNSDSNS